MADNALANALNLNFSPLDTGYGIGAQTIGQATPALINPYGNVGTNFGIVLGSALLQGLLGYQARQEATSQSLLANRLGMQMLAAPTAQERLTIAEQAGDTGVQRRLLDLNQTLLAQQAARDQLINEEVAKQEALAKFNLGDVGTKLYRRNLEGNIELEQAKTKATAKPAETWWDKLGAKERSAFSGVNAQVANLNDLARQFRELNVYGPQLQIQALKPGSPADLALKRMKTIVPSTVKMLGDSGALAVQEQQNILDAMLGSKLSGSDTIAKSLEQLAAMTEDKIQNQMQTYKNVYTYGPEILLKPPKTTGETAEQKNARLKAQLQRLEARLGMQK